MSNCPRLYRMATEPAAAAAAAALAAKNRYIYILCVSGYQALESIE